jgi:hypothetical protein
MSQFICTNRRALLSFGATATFLLPAIGAAFASGSHASMAATKNRTTDTKRLGRTEKTSQTAAVLRDVWVGHIFWVRAVCVALVNKQEAPAVVGEQQAVENAKSIAATIKPFYGGAAAEGFFKLLAGHYGAVKAYLLATIADDASAQSKAVDSLTSNAGEIAIFLSNANPFLPKDAVNGLLLAHGGHHIQQIQQLKEGKFGAEAQTWEEMKIHVYQIADTTADALAKQFVKKFA